MGSSQDRFSEYREVDAEIISHARDGFTLDINGTQVHFRQDSVPVLLEIYVGDETEPIGSLNIAKESTVALGGTTEDLSGQITEHIDTLEDVLRGLEDMEHRLNPGGTPSPGSIYSRPGEPRFKVICDCGESWFPHKETDYQSPYSGDPNCPHCHTDWRELDGAQQYVADNGNPSFD